MTNKHTSDPAFGIVSFTADAGVIDALDRVAAEALLSRAQFVRNLVVKHLRSTNRLSADAPVTRRCCRVSV